MSHEIQQYGSRLNGGAGAPATAEPVAAPAARYSLSELEQIADCVVRSAMFPGIQSKQQAMSLMLLCEADNLHPMHAVRRFHVVPQRPPQMKADVMLAEFLKAGGRVAWKERSADRVCGVFSHREYCPEGVEIEWTLQQARAAGVGSGGGMLTKFPRQMMTARCISEGVRLVCPGVISGIYTPEELDDATTITVIESQPVPAPTPAPAIVPPSAKPQPKRSDASPPDTWENHMRTAKAACDVAWRRSLADHGVTEAEAGEWGTLIARDGYHRIVNHIITAALEAGYITQPHVGKDDNVAVRDADKAKKAVRGLYETDAAWVRGQLTRWIDKRRAEAESALGWTVAEVSHGEPGDGFDDDAARAEFGPGADG